MRIDPRDPRDAASYESKLAQAYRDQKLESFWRAIDRRRQLGFNPDDERYQRSTPAFLRAQA